MLSEGYNYIYDVLPVEIDLSIKHYLNSEQILEQNKYYGNLNKETDSNIQTDYIYILTSLCILLTISLVLFKYNFLTQNIIILVIFLFMLIDYYRIDIEIIDAKNHKSGKSLVVSSDVFSTYLEEDEVVNFLKLMQKNSKPFRIYDGTSSNSLNRFASFGIESIMGYHAVVLADYEDLLDNTSNIFSILNVKYYLLDKPDDSSKIITENIRSLYHPEYNRNKDVQIYEIPDFKERLFFVKEITKKELIYVNPDIAHIQNSHINTDNFIYDKDAIVEIIDYKPGKIEFITNCNSEQFLFISENHYPGWKLYNKENAEESIPLHKVNISFMGAFIPEGQKTFILEFKSDSLSNGIIISIITVLVILSILVIGYRKEYYNRENI